MTAPLSPEKLNEIKELCEAVPVPPWFVAVKGNTVKSHQVIDGWHTPICSGIRPSTKIAAFIAHAREDIPALVAEVERLRAALEKIANIAYADYDSEECYIARRALERAA